MDIYRKLTFKRNKHEKYLLRFLDVLPAACQNLDPTRITIAFFAISGLDILGSLDDFTDERRKNIISWIYSLQIINDNENTSGFQPSHILDDTETKNKNTPYKWSHIASTYCALCCLLILGDDLSGVNREAIIKSLRALQLPNGCYTAAKDGTENDMRFVYCAACICYILNDWSGMDIDKATDFILQSISYDFGIAQAPELESHGGSSYCAIATLALTNRLDCLTQQQTRGLVRWLLYRQEDGFQGRPNKPVDTCYSFWIGSALNILGAYQFIDYFKNRQFVLLTQDSIIGGFSKWVDTSSDPIHTYLGLAGLSLMNDADLNLNEVFPSLNITKRAHEHLLQVQLKWT